MKTATQKLLSLRPNSKHVNVSLKKYRGGKANLCFQNSAIYAATRDGYEIVSGWMVGDNVEGFGTILVPHYWLIHLPTGTYFDTTPRAIGDNQMYEYVIDADIYKHVTQTSYIPPAVVLREDGSIQARLGMKHFTNLEKIDILQLYNLIRD